MLTLINNDVSTSIYCGRRRFIGPELFTVSETAVAVLNAISLVLAVHDIEIHTSTTMNFFDTYEVSGTTTPPANPQPQPSLNEEVEQVVGQLSRFWGGFRKQVRTCVRSKMRLVDAYSLCVTYACGRFLEPDCIRVC